MLGFAEHAFEERVGVKRPIIIDSYEWRLGNCSHYGAVYEVTSARSTLNLPPPYSRVLVHVSERVHPRHDALHDRVFALQVLDQDEAGAFHRTLSALALVGLQDDAMGF